MIKNIVAVLFVIITLFACGESKLVPGKAEEVFNTEILPDQSSIDIEVHFVDSSFTKAILNADTAKVFQQRKETFLIGSVKVRFFDENHRGEASVLTSDSARIDDNTNNMLARGNVYVISDVKQTTLRTSILNWDNNSRKLYSTEYVKIISPRETIEGYGFESDQTLSNYKIFKVTGISK